jgi:hypothetical protein
MPAVQSARDRLRVALGRARSDQFRLCRRLGELEIRRFDSGTISRASNVLMAARAEAVAGGTKPPIPDGENYEVVAVSSATLLS